MQSALLLYPLHVSLGRFGSIKPRPLSNRGAIPQAECEQPRGAPVTEELNTGLVRKRLEAVEGRSATLVWDLLWEQGKPTSLSHPDLLRQR